MYIFLTCTKRAPLKLAMQHVRNVHRNIHLQTASTSVQHAVNQTLNRLGWRRREYIAAVKQYKKSMRH
jgi:Holliday junction resolvasome RuvABC DNA-binding subunit